MAAAVADVLVVSGPVEKNKSAMLVDGGTDEEEEGGGGRGGPGW